MTKLCYIENYFSLLNMKLSVLPHRYPKDDPFNPYLISSSTVVEEGVESDSSVCESIDEISKQEIDNYNRGAACVVLKNYASAPPPAPDDYSSF